MLELVKKWISREGARPARPRWLGRRFCAGALAATLLAAVAYEVKTSYLQATLFTRIASDFDFHLGEGASDEIRFPRGGPYDERLGYSRIPLLVARLDSLGFDVARQARSSRSLLRWAERGVYPIYPPKGPVGLRVLDRREEPLLEERFPGLAYESFDSIPELLWRTLLYVESRELLDEAAPRRNPAVEWDRLLVGTTNLVLRELGAERAVPGGSTLATQLEKYRHSPGGATASPADKLRQMLSASLRAYASGPDTYAHRRRIVLEYLNSVPLAGQNGHGEVVGIGEALWAWYGTRFAHANSVLRREPSGAADRLERARIYRQVLSLVVAQRRPTFYLARAEGRRELQRLTNTYLRLLERDGVIPASLAQDARRLGSTTILDAAPSLRKPTFPSTNKGAGSVRAHLLELTGVRRTYDLDRLDLEVVSTLDRGWDATVREVFDGMKRSDFLAGEGFRADGLLATGDPSNVLYSVLLLERTDLGNVVRIQADNFPAELSLAEGSRLELGSTAKLRTLVTYLEVIEELYARLADLEPEALRRERARARDPLTRWVATRLAVRPGTPLAEILDAALAREYSASPHERFATGGSVLVFSNFDTRFDDSVLSVREAFRHSVNLPFVRLMRDLVAYEIDQLETADLLENRDDPRRREYLVKFAEHEGAQYVVRFHARYRNRVGHEVFATLLGDRRLSALEAAWAVRAVAPDAPLGTFTDVLRTYGPELDLTDERAAQLYARADPTGLSLSDLGHLARIHPLELWVASHRLDHPSATRADVMAASREALIDVYGWLLRTSRQDAQDARIRSILEIEAFQRIHQRWRRLGYPFESLTPSLGTAIGSSGDRPLALAELAGIILNDGARLPTVRVEELRFARGTPFETWLRPRPADGERVLGEEVAAALKSSLFDVVEHGTGWRARGALLARDGTPLAIGGKTGTGDNRRHRYDARGRLVSSSVVNRTASFVFVAGDRYFGVVTAYVQGPRAGEYRFTSALAVQLLRAVGRRLAGLEGPASSTPSPSPEPLPSLFPVQEAGATGLLGPEAGGSPSETRRLDG